jgi:molecular chaperone HtpG
MVSDKVQIDTLSYQEGAESVRWECSGGTEYSISQSDRDSRGTTVTLYISEDSSEFLKEYTLKETMEKYCSFLPIEIYFEAVKEAQEDNEEKEVKPINDIHPLWMKKPEDCTEEEYKEFYRKVFSDYQEPLFWIHLHVDYPFNLKGILFFPKLKHEFESIEGQIKLYNNQVYVADNIKEIIPEYLMLLKGVIDCSDMPLNVSRSFLQNDSNVIKISQHITKKVGDKLIELFKNERERYNSFWDDINPFIKYGCLRDTKFYERVKDIIIFKTTEGEYVTLKDYLEKNKDKHEKKVFYVTDEAQQAQYIRIFKEHDMEAIILTSTIDRHFITFLEMQENSVSFARVDSNLSETLKSEKAEDTQNTELNAGIENLFRTVLNDDKLKIQIEALKTDDIPAMILLSEQSRRMQEMSSMFGGMDVKSMFPQEQTLVLNRNSKLIQSVVELGKSDSNKENVSLICHHIYDLAMMSHKQLEASEMTEFIKRSNQILAMIAG